MSLLPHKYKITDHYINFFQSLKRRPFPASERIIPTLRQFWFTLRYSESITALLYGHQEKYCQLNHDTLLTVRGIVRLGGYS